MPQTSRESDEYVFLGIIVVLHHSNRFREIPASAKPEHRSKRLEGSGTAWGEAKIVVESTPAVRALPNEGSKTAVKLPLMFIVDPSDNVIVTGEIVPVRVASNGVCVSYTRVSKKKVEPSPAEPSE